MEDSITLRPSEQRRVQVLLQLAGGVIPSGQAAELLSVSEREVRRLAAALGRPAARFRAFPGMPAPATTVSVPTASFHPSCRNQHSRSPRRRGNHRIPGAMDRSESPNCWQVRLL
jgi:hypothetical protein